MRKKRLIAVIIILIFTVALIPFPLLLKPTQATNSYPTDGSDGSTTPTIDPFSDYNFYETYPHADENGISFAYDKTLTNVAEYSGSLTDTYRSDNTYWKLEGTIYDSEVYVKFSVGLASGQQFKIKIEHQTDFTSDVNIYIYNWDTSSWVDTGYDLDTPTTEDVVTEIVLTNTNGQYASGSSEYIYLKFDGGLLWGSGDYLYIDYMIIMPQASDGSYMTIWAEDFSHVADWSDNGYGGSISTDGDVADIWDNTASDGQGGVRLYLNVYVATTSNTFMEVYITDRDLQWRIRVHCTDSTAYYITAGGGGWTSALGQIYYNVYEAIGAVKYIDYIEIYASENLGTAYHVYVDYIRFYEIEDYSWAGSSVNRDNVVYNDGSRLVMRIWPDDTGDEWFRIEYDVPNFETNTYKYFVYCAYEDSTEANGYFAILYNDSSVDYPSFGTSNVTRTFELKPNLQVDKVLIYVNDYPNSISSGKYYCYIYFVTFSVAEINIDSITVNLEDTWASPNQTISISSITAKWADGTAIDSAKFKVDFWENSTRLTSNSTAPFSRAVQLYNSTYMLGVSWCSDTRYRFWVVGSNYTFWIAGTEVYLDFEYDWSRTSSGGFLGTYYQIAQAQWLNGSVVSNQPTITFWSNSTNKGYATIETTGWLPYRQFWVSEPSSATWVNIWANVSVGSFWQIVENSTFYLPDAASTLEAARIDFHNQRGEYIPFDSFRTVIHHDKDGSTEPLYYNVFQMDRYETIDIYVYDVWDQLVYSASNLPYQPFYSIEIVSYSYKINNHQEDFVHINLTREGTGAYWSEWLAPYETAEYFLVSDNYTLKVTYTNGTYAEYSGIPITTDYYFLIEGDTLHDVMNNIYMVDAHLDNVNQSISDQIYSVNITIGNVNTSIANQFITVNLNLSNVNSTITTQITDLHNFLSNVNATIITNINNLNSSITNQFIELWANITNINSTIASQFATVMADISNTNSTLAAQYLYVIGNVTNLNSTMLSQFSTVLTNIYYTNQSVFQSKLDLLSKIDWADQNAINRALEILQGQVEVKSQINLVQVLSVIATIGTIIVSTYTIYKKIVKPYAPRIKHALETTSLKEIITRKKKTTPLAVIEAKRRRAEERRRSV